MSQRILCLLSSEMGWCRSSGRATLGAGVGVGVAVFQMRLPSPMMFMTAGRGSSSASQATKIWRLKNSVGVISRVVVVPEDGLATNGVVVEATEPEGSQPALPSRKLAAEGGVFLQDTGIDEVAHGDHVFHGEADGVIQGEEGAGFTPIAGAGVGIAAASAVEDYGDVEFGDEIPESVVFGVVPELAFLGSGHH